MQKKSSFNYIYQITKPYFFSYFLAFIFLCFTNFLLISLSLKYGQSIQLIKNNSFSDELFKSILLFGICLILIRSLSRILVFTPGRKIENNLKIFFFSHFLKLPLKIEGFNQGSIISLGTNEMNTIRMFLSFNLLHIMNTFILTISILYAMIKISFYSTLISILFLFISILFTKKFSFELFSKMKESQEKTRRGLNEVQGAADIEKMKRPENTESGTTSVEQEVESFLEKITGSNQ